MVEKLLGTRFMGVFKWIWFDFIMGIYNWVMWKRNPLCQLFYLGLTCSGFEVTVRVGMGKFCPGPYLAEYHKVTGSLLMFLCFFSFYKASMVGPGVIENKE